MPRRLYPICHPGVLGAYAGFLFQCYSQALHGWGSGDTIKNSRKRVVKHGLQPRHQPARVRRWVSDLAAGIQQSLWRNPLTAISTGCSQIAQLGRFGYKLGTGLAILAQCDYKIHRSRRYRNRLENRDFKHRCNVFPIPRRWQTRRTQNPVLARGCGFKSHLRYSRLTARSRRFPRNSAGVQVPPSVFQTQGRRFTR